MFKSAPSDSLQIPKSVCIYKTKCIGKNYSVGFADAFKQILAANANINSLIFFIYNKASRTINGIQF
jgi:hypothetical protein